jgi:hypothetical protein
MLYKTASGYVTSGKERSATEDMVAIGFAVSGVRHTESAGPGSVGVVIYDTLNWKYQKTTPTSTISATIGRVFGKSIYSLSHPRKTMSYALSVIGRGSARH